MRKQDWEAVMTRVMRKDRNYQYMELVRLVAAEVDKEVSEVQGSVCYTILGNRSQRFQRVARGTYRRIA